MTGHQVARLTCVAVPLPGEVRGPASPATGGLHGLGSDIAAALADHDELDGGLADGDVVVVTSKAVSKAEGRVSTARKADVVAAETDRVVARRGTTAIVRTRNGLVLAAAGVDASNTAPGTLVLLPRDPDRSARELRTRLSGLTGRNLAVLVTDTFGRAWRNGQTDVAVGAAGLGVLDDYAGRTDPYGNPLEVTAPAVADEIAAAADLVKGKLAGAPVALARGLAAMVLPADEDGPGAAALVRPESQDMFGLGAREAVVEAVAAASGDPDPVTARGFGSPAPADVLHAALDHVARAQAAGTGLPHTAVREVGDALEVSIDGTHARLVGGLEARLRAVVVAHGWRVHEQPAAPHHVRLRALPTTA